MRTVALVPQQPSFVAVVVHEWVSVRRKAKKQYWLTRAVRGTEITKNTSKKQDAIVFYTQIADGNRELSGIHDAKSQELSWQFVYACRAVRRR